MMKGEREIILLRATLSNCVPRINSHLSWRLYLSLYIIFIFSQYKGHKASICSTNVAIVSFNGMSLS